MKKAKVSSEANIKLRKNWRSICDSAESIAAIGYLFENQQGESIPIEDQDRIFKEMGSIIRQNGEKILDAVALLRRQRIGSPSRKKNKATQAK